MLSEDSPHRRWAEEAIKNCLERYEYPPIIFVGSGLSKRYLGAPGWKELLGELAEDCPKIDYPINYYTEENEEPGVATEFIDPYRDWAWEDQGTYAEFPEELYKAGGHKDKYLKYKVAEYFRDLSPDSLEDLPEEYQDEIKSLRQISPSAIVTTNYDFLLETIFPGFEKMVGQEIYKKENKKVGDFFKIHGCASQKDSILLTEEDYDRFEENKKYIGAKLLTYFTEHPVLILGHSATDDNIQQILSDLDRMIPTENDDLIDNIFLINYERDASRLNGDPNLPREKLIDIGNDRRVRVNSITAHSFEWIYDSFGQDTTIDQIQIEQARKFTSKIYDVTTRDAPRKKINFERLEYFSDEDNIEKLLGFVPIDNPETVEGLRKAGIPIGEGEVSTEPVDDINARLNTATQNYRSNGTLIDQRSTVLEFRKRISDLELTIQKCELLIRSSLKQGLQGADWILHYDGDIQSLFNSIINDESVGAHSIRRLEYNLLILGYEDLLLELYRLHPNNGLLKGGLDNKCGLPIEERLEEYGSSTNILFTDEDIDVLSLRDDVSQLDQLLDICADILIEGETSDDPGGNSATDFRKLELTKLSNNIDQLS